MTAVALAVRTQDPVFASPNRQIGSLVLISAVRASVVARVQGLVAATLQNYILETFDSPFTLVLLSASDTLS